MQTVSKTYGAADAEAQEPALKPQGLSRAAVASICFAAALSGAAVASVARVRTRTYAADLYAGLGGTAYGPDQLNMKQCGPSGKVCEGTTRCYEKVKNDGTTKYKCAELESLGDAWKIAGARPGSTRTSKKKSTDSLSGGGHCSAFEDMDVCSFNIDGVCDGEDYYSNQCMACLQGAKGPFKHIGMEGRPDDCKK
jgi:hypothetical protein